MCYVYILECEDGMLYVGSTTLVPAHRLLQHLNGEYSQVAYAHRPKRIIYTEEFKTVAAAVKREKQLKGWSRAKKLALASGDTDSLRRLSRARKAPP